MTHSSQAPRAVRWERTESQEGQGKCHLCQHLGWKRTAVRVTWNLHCQPTPGTRGHFLLNAVAREETHRGRCHSPRGQISCDPHPCTVSNSHHHGGHKSPRDTANIWERGVSKLGCVGWSCSEASHSE